MPPSEGWRQPAVGGEDDGVLGAVLIIVVLLVAGPALWWVTWGVVAAGLGWLLTANAEEAHAGSELIETNY